MDWSFQLYSARKFPPWETVLKTLAEAGYTQVEGYGAVYDDPQRFRAELDRNGLAMPSGHFSVDALENDFATVEKTAKTLGIKLIACPYLEAGERPTDAAGWQAFGKKLGGFAGKAKGAGFDFAWHNHDFEVQRLPDGSMPLTHLLDAAPDVGLEMDVAWIVRGGANPIEWIEKYGSRVQAVHVKDIAAQGQGQDEDGWSDVGFGTIDWKTMLGELRRRTPAKYYIMEQDNPNDLARFARRSIESVRTY